MKIEIGNKKNPRKIAKHLETKQKPFEKIKRSKRKSEESSENTLDEQK